MIFLPFDEARKIVHKLGLSSSQQWNEYCKSGKIPNDIPKTPWHMYKSKWKSMGDWLGTGLIANQKRQFKQFSDAKEFVQKLGLKSTEDWETYCKSGNKPIDIPALPSRTYKTQWKGMGDWLGTNYIAHQNRKYRAFNDAREFVRKLGLKSEKEWKAYCNSGKKPTDLPSYPQGSYKSKWKSMGDWLGTGYVVAYKRQYRAFEDARDFVRRLKFKSSKDWKLYCESKNKPADIPNAPWHVYADMWKGIGDWLGTGNLAPKNRTFRTFKEARKFAHSLKLKYGREWKEYCQSNKKPDDIPSNPNKTYARDWKGMGDWLGTGSVAIFNKQFRSFKKAREFVHSLELKNYKEWKKYCKSGSRPVDIPANPRDSYGKEFNGYGDWLGTDNIGWKGRKYRSFNEARSFVHKLKLTSQSDWKEYCKSGNKPDYIPSFPSRRYKAEWKGMGDWLGTGYVATYKRQYKIFDKAKEFVRNLGLKNQSQWNEYCKSGNKPDDIPATPARTYKNEWKGIGDWLGTGYIAPKDRKYKSFAEARAFVHSLGLKNQSQWNEYCKSANKPKDIPNYPDYTYKNEWKGIGDWLGTGYIAPKDRKYKSFAEARAFVHNLGLNNRDEWNEYCQSVEKPDDIPGTPERIYKDEWKGVGDWLGTGFIASSKRNYRPFHEAREFAHNIKLNTVDEWKRYCRSEKKPVDIPAYPDAVYESEWTDWFDWLGIPGIRWDVTKIKELLRDMIKSRILYDWDEAVLYSFLNRKGLLNVGESNRHKSFFKNLIEASRTQEGLH